MAGKEKVTPIVSSNPKTLVTEKQVERTYLLTMLALRELFPKVFEENIAKEYVRITGASPPEESPPERILFEVGRRYSEEPTEEELQELLHEFEKESVHEKLSRYHQLLKKAEQERDTESASLFTKEITTLTKVLATLSPRNIL